MKELFYFSDDWKNIAVKVSGGADSAIMWYAACDYYKNKDVNLYALTLDTQYKPWYSTGAKRVIEKVKELTGVEPTEHLIYYSSKHINKETANWYIEEQKNMIRYWYPRYRFNVLYNCVTSNPPEEDMINEVKKYIPDENKFKVAKKYIEGRDKNRDVESNKYRTQIESPFPMFVNIRPFVHEDKKLTRQVYDYYGVADTLFPVTYSCETIQREHLYNPKEEMDFDHCGYCFFCCERYYAFGKLV